jgi:two-component system NarL family sensor kinase
MLFTPFMVDSYFDLAWPGLGESTMPLSNAQKLQRRNRELSILNTIAEALNREVNLDNALQTVLQHVADLLDLKTGWIFLLNEETNKFYPAASLNLPPILAHNPKRLTGYCYCLDTYEAGDLDGAANVNVITCSRLHKLVDGTDGLQYHSSIPLYAYNKQLGVLNVASTDWQELSDEDLQLLYTVGDLLSIAIERARLFQRSTQLGVVEERNRLAREIHDTLAQGLTALSLKLETVDALLEANADSEQVQQIVGQALTLTRTNLEEARRSVLDLRAAPLEGRTLVQALSDLADHISQQEGVAITFQTMNTQRPLPLGIEVGLYRIVQEALNNICQHAAASKVKIDLTISTTDLKLVIEDNGQGFDPAQIPKNSFGLIGVSERARLLGGCFQIQSDAGLGAKAEVTIPVEKLI